MVEFSGNVSEKCKWFILKQESKILFFAGLIATVIISMICIPIAALFDLWIITLFIAVSFLVAILLAIPQIKVIGSNVPQKIILNEGVINLQREKNPVTKSVSEVKKVIDFGEWYQIVFYFGHINIYFICQKNLITQGTIEEFEAIFAGKIHRKK